MIASSHGSGKWPSVRRRKLSQNPTTHKITRLSRVNTFTPVAEIGTIRDDVGRATPRRIGSSTTFALKNLLFIEHVKFLT
jgi:hypothetical protein